MVESGFIVCAKPVKENKIKSRVRFGFNRMIIDGLTTDWQINLMHILLTCGYFVNYLAATLQIIPLTSSATSNAPSGVKVTPTGLP